MARGKKSKRNKKRARRHRESARWSLDRVVERTTRDFDLGSENWRDQLIRFACGPRFATKSLERYVDAHQSRLGPRWAALFLAFEEEMLRQSERAERIYEEALCTYPPCAWVEATMGDVCLLILGRLHRARRHYQAAVALEPELANAHYELGLVYHALGLFERAAGEFKTAAQLAGGREDEREVAARASFNLGSYQWNLGECAISKQLIRKALEYMPDYPEAQASLDAIKARGM